MRSILRAVMLTDEQKQRYAILLKESKEANDQAEAKRREACAVLEEAVGGLQKQTMIENGQMAGHDEYAELTRDGNAVVVTREF